MSLSFSFSSSLSMILNLSSFSSRFRLRLGFSFLPEILDPLQVKNGGSEVWARKSMIPHRILERHGHAHGIQGPSSSSSVVSFITKNHWMWVGFWVHRRISCFLLLDVTSRPAFARRRTSRRVQRRFPRFLAISKLGYGRASAEVRTSSLSDVLQVAVSSAFSAFALS